MKRKSIALLLAIVICLGLTVPAFAETMSKTIDGITFTANSNGTLTYSGSGKLTRECAGYSAESLLMLMDAADTVPDTVSIKIGSGITVDTQIREQIKTWLFQFGVKNVKINNNSTTEAEWKVTSLGFTDVKPGDYFANPVVWAVDRHITAGTSKTKFSPNTKCTVAQILTFLYRANGSPKTFWDNPFSDVKSSDYYYKAALWAYEKGMVTGSTFGGDRLCTRSMAVTYIWKADVSKAFGYGLDGWLYEYYHQGDYGVVTNVVIPDHVAGIGEITLYNCESLTSVTIPTSVTAIGEFAFDNCNGLTDIYYEGSKEQWKDINIDSNNRALSEATIHYNTQKPSVNTGFTDVPADADYAQAVAWAVEKGVTAGTSPTTFAPDNVCTRGQIVTFLYRGLASK